MVLESSMIPAILSYLIDRWDGEGAGVGGVNMMRLAAIATMSTVSQYQIHS